MVACLPARSEKVELCRHPKSERPCRCGPTILNFVRFSPDSEYATIGRFEERGPIPIHQDGANAIASMTRAGTPVSGVSSCGHSCHSSCRCLQMPYNHSCSSDRSPENDPFRNHPRTVRQLLHRSFRQCQTPGPAGQRFVSRSLQFSR